MTGGFEPDGSGTDLQPINAPAGVKVQSAASGHVGANPTVPTSDAVRIIAWALAIGH